MTSLDEVLNIISSKKHPPVEQWNPDSCGEIDIKILRDGTWLHEGKVIKRKALVQLFSNILIYNQNEYFLITPIEKLKITVECTPFVVIDEAQVEDYWVFTNNLGEVQLLDQTHSLNTENSHCPVFLWHRNLPARISAKVMYRLQMYAIENGGLEGDQLWLKSGSDRFLLTANQPE
jgi:hypothetical protein